ncbi:phosphatase PAP2 family protein [Aeromicrobium phragmitis]|uniref:Phosphatase PAP2 family protein n=1 Tax=Aeromicrobium phragmitis TaxID=2478914 RepID=A0A3L8PPP1_9ACTN|nr:diacylglycerol kinase family protein [Aeromicrobium phragmitis]RLV57341.1 phosphatase PAP2 family protein [Aeromicrobium phragmitis]
MAIDVRRADPDRGWQIPVLLVVLGVLFAVPAIGLAAGWEAQLDLDAQVADAAYQVSSHRPWLVDVLEVVAALFSTLGVSVVLAVMLAGMLIRREHAVAVWIFCSGLLVLAGNALLKLVFDRDRPFWDEPLHEIGGHAFPSGHASGSGMLFTVISLVTIISTGRGWKRRLLLALWILLALGVASSRVFLGVHYLSDVVAGLAVGSFATCVLWLLIVRGKGRLPSELAIVTGSGARTSAVILNPSKIGDVAEFRAKVGQVAAAHGWNEPRWYETTVEDPGHGQTRAAIDAGVDLVVAAGGDGTVRAVCEEAARTGVAVGILPHGTGNLLARNLDIPVNTRDALDVVFGGQDRAIDLATFRTDGDTDSVFLVMAGLGMDAMIMSGVNDELKRKVGFLAYFVSGVKALAFPRTKVTITIDDQEPVTFKARTVVVGNVGFLQGGIPLLPQAEIDDGMLDVVVVAPKRFLGWLAIVARVMTRRPTNDKRLSRLCGERVHIVAERKVPMQLDGDGVGEASEITAEVHQGVVLVRVPVELGPAR